MTKTTQQLPQLSLMEAAEMMRSYYAEGGELTEFSDLNQEDFYEDYYA
jgi:hypothetical protein